MQSKHSKKKLFIGITGGIGSGKSLVCSYFKELGCRIFYADEIARNLYFTSKTLLNALVREFGKNILDGKTKGISIEKFRNIVFASERNQTRVNRIVHPFVIKEIIRLTEKLKARIILVEAALIFESGFDKYLDYTVEVFSPVKLRIQRVRRSRSKLTVKDIRSIIKLQMPEKEKLLKADFILRNSGSKIALRKEVKALYRVFLSLISK
jgi:dephospho-CoA kinase